MGVGVKWNVPKCIAIVIYDKAFSHLFLKLEICQVAPPPLSKNILIEVTGKNGNKCYAVGHFVILIIIFYFKNKTWPLAHLPLGEGPWLCA